MGTKPKKVKKAKKAKKTRAVDPCQPLRNLLAVNQQQIADIQEALGDPDIPEGIKRGLRTVLARLQALRRRLITALERCERRNG